MVNTSQSQLNEWLPQRCRALGLSDAQAYAQWLSDPSHLKQDREALCNLLTSRETYFLRDHGVVDVLREHVLKESIAQKTAERTLKIWSVGCSTGEEIYTLSILLAEGLLDVNSWHIDLLGSDIDQEALTIARHAVYHQWSFRGCPPEFSARYFFQKGTDLHLMDHIKRRVRFEQLDIVGDTYPTADKGMSKADIILCRNVFIYLDNAAIDTALEKLTACLNENGFLLCAPGELHAHSHPQLKTRIFPQALVYQKNATELRLQTTPLEMLQVLQTLQAGQTTTKTQTAPPHAAQAHTPTARNESVITLERAWGLANRGDTVAATEMCNALIGRQALDPDVRYLHAVLLLAQGHTAKSREALRHVLYLDPQFAVAYVMLADVCMADNDRAGALRACHQGLKTLTTQASDATVPYFKAVTYGSIRQYLHTQIDTLSQDGMRP
jgi:chemotaxis protein methyltransferase CheR